MRLAILSLFGLAVAAGCGRPPEPPSRGFVVVNAAVVDGTGSPARDVHVVVEGDRITSVELGDPPAGYEVVDAGGRTLAPGFIDTHSHGDSQIAGHRAAEAAVSQGITTIVGGQDGSSVHPLSELFGRLSRSPAAVNVASFAGHGTLREQVLGSDFRRPATPEEIEEMRRLLAEEMRSGALGLGTGLEYDPGIYSETAEVVALAREAASWGGRYVSHLRSEDRSFWEAVDEILTIGREARLPVQISHVKLAMQSLHGEAEALIARLEEARARGIDVSADLYPYPYWQSTMTVLFPERDFDDREAAELAVTEITTPEGMLVPRFAPEPSYAGKTLAQIAELRGTDPAQTLMDLIREAEALRETGAENVESIIATSMDEADIETLMRWEHTSISTDGALEGAHPRGYGTYPRVLGRYVRERGVLTLEEAVRKMTSLPAAQMGIADRGRIAPGMKADLVLFDPRSVLDRATPEEPHALAEGIARVWVNGVVVFEDGRTTGVYPGVVVKRGE